MRKRRADLLTREEIELEKQAKERARETKIDATKLALLYCRQSTKKQTRSLLCVPGEEDDDLEEEALDFCPLDLSSGDPARIEKATFAILNMENSVMIADPTPPSDDEGDSDTAAAR